VIAPAELSADRAFVSPPPRHGFHNRRFEASRRLTKLRRRKPDDEPLPPLDVTETEAIRLIGRLLTQVSRGQPYVVWDRQGRPVAVLLPPEQAQAIVDLSEDERCR
jgi:hypothetical protein